jgi:hypothetical protein
LRYTFGNGCERKIGFEERITYETAIPIFTSHILDILKPCRFKKQKKLDNLGTGDVLRRIKFQKK